MNKEILSLGAYLPLSPEGFIVNDCPTSLSLPWKELIDVFLDEISKNPELDVHSVYVRGSIARGFAIIGISDLDALIVLNRETTDIVKSALPRELDRKLSQNFQFYTGLDVNFLNYDVLLHSNRGADYRFMLKTQSICVAGQNLIGILPNYTPSYEIAFGCKCLPKDILKFHKHFESETDSNRRILCEWIMRKLLRVGGELAMLKTKQFSRDLTVCAKAYCDINPSVCEDIRKALDLAINPSCEGAIVAPVVEKLSWHFNNEIDFVENGR